MRSLSSAGSVITDESSPMTVPAVATRFSVASSLNFVNQRETVGGGTPVFFDVATVPTPCRKHSRSSSIEAWAFEMRRCEQLIEHAVVAGE